MVKEKNNYQLYQYEEKFWNKNLSVCGIDEVGRGCLAGPIVTCAAIIHKNQYHPKLADSKKLTKKTMLEVYEWLTSNCTYSIGINSSRIIDQKNIYQTTKLTMKQALMHLQKPGVQTPSIILIDAMLIDMSNTLYENIKQVSLIKGESKSASIAAASVIAKVTRDTILQRLDTSFPSYNLKQHKGYGTKQHQESILSGQPSILHRNTYLKNLLSKE
ncbi:MAG: ribonuclease HII [Epsilonproteobacteria bacterium]|nr:ribonuclease HII [Campylobacterota bacterium]|tara:strand:- start:2617 stop:3264 length:648 start_codon:yes stop_codon:yes gene_type:complete